MSPLSHAEADARIVTFCREFSESPERVMTPSRNSWSKVVYVYNRDVRRRLVKLNRGNQEVGNRIHKLRAPEKLRESAPTD